MKWYSLLLVSLAVGNHHSLAKERVVSDPSLLKEISQAASPGDTLVLAAGHWQDVALELQATGTAEQPITLKAAQAGKSQFTGKSTLRFSGQNLIIEGLWFRNPDPGLDHVISFRTDSEHLAQHCTLRHCAVTADPAASGSGKEGRWCSLYGTHNSVQHCQFTGKNSAGTTLVVWITEGTPAQHQITDCYFGERRSLGKNGGETVRIGDSKTNLLSAKCTVSGCLFGHCNGETEIISNKSCDNLYTGNTFLECEGALTLRHGHRCTVTQNWFLGQGKPMTGGVRIMGEGHQITHNTFIALTGEGFRGALTFMLGDTRSNGYQQVRNVTVANNTWVNCEHTILIGMAHNAKCTLLPERVTMRRNVMLAPKCKLIEQRSRTPEWQWVGNLLSAASVGIDLPMADLSSCKPDTTGLWHMPAASQQGAQMKSLPRSPQATGTQGWKP